MIRKNFLVLVTILLMAAVCIAGCSFNLGTPTPTTVPTTIQTVPPAPTAEPTVGTGYHNRCYDNGNTYSDNRESDPARNRDTHDKDLHDL